MEPCAEVVYLTSSHALRSASLASLCPVYSMLLDLMLAMCTARAYSCLGPGFLPVRDGTRPRKALMPAVGTVVSQDV